MKVFSPFLNGDTTTSGSFTLPQHPTSASISNPNTGSIYHDTTDNIVKVYTGTQWQVVGEQTLPSVGPASADIEYLVVAGGGGGGSAGAGAGAGGAGGLLSSSLSSVTSGSTFTVTIGAGGAAGTGTGYGNNGVAGVDSSIAGATISTITATGGGLGSGGDTVGGSGGSGGGGNGGYSRSGGSGTVGQGNDGGDGLGYFAPGDDSYGGGGGGGATQSGFDGFANSSVEIGGNGGSGSYSNITGTLTPYAGGGGGGAGYRKVTTGGTGGVGGGGAGASSYSSIAGSAGTPNTGGGGGGGGGLTSDPNGGSGQNGGAGGSGVAIFAYDSGSINCAGGIIGDAGNGRKYNQFNSSGTLKVGNTSTDFDNIVTSNLSVNLDAGNFASRGTSTWTDLQGNYNGTANGSISLPDYYYDFDGTDDYVQFATGMSSLFEGQSTVSVEFWCQIDTVGSHILFGKYASNVQTGGYQFNTDGSGQPNFFIANSSDQRLTANASTALSANTWTHLVYIFDGSKSITNGTGGRLQAFKDTIELSMTYGVTTNHTTIPTTSTTGVKQNRLGIVNYSDGSGAYLSGKIAQFRVYSKALTAAEILQNYNATKTNFV